MNLVETGLQRLLLRSGRRGLVLAGLGALFFLLTIGLIRARVRAARDAPPASGAAPGRTVDP